MEYVLLAIALIVVFYIAPAIAVPLLVYARQKPLPPFDFSAQPYAALRQPILDAICQLEGYPHETVTICSADGTVLTGEQYGEGKRLAIFFHGFHANARVSFGTQALHFLQNGFSVLLVQQRAQNGADGRFIGMGLLEQEDVLAWCNWAKYDELLLYGTSMGAASVAYASDRLPDKVKALVLDCGFASPEAQMNRECRAKHLPTKLFMPLCTATVRLFLGLDVRRQTSDPMSRCRIPTLFLHGLEDRSVPHTETQALYDGYRGEKELLLVPNADHAVSYLVGLPQTQEKVTQWIQQYFQEVL